MLLLGRLVLFTLTSSVSYIAILLIIFSLFRIQYRWYIPQMLFVCVSLSYISFTTREASLALYSPFIQIGFLIVLLWLLFRFHPFHALIMGVTGSICFGAIDVAVGLLFALAGYGVEQFSVALDWGAGWLARHWSGDHNHQAELGLLLRSGGRAGKNQFAGKEHCITPVCKYCCGYWLFCGLFLHALFKHAHEPFSHSPRLNPWYRDVDLLVREARMARVREETELDGQITGSRR
ncbi:hypothetical protein [Xylanibacillus composti]|uniref:hypothetical protein n=1 Tax=Xylanibacillus composti TaxID=1572762 RepID=UPI001BCBB21D|nr:hypothetical protein [Xylanibacillus composti]